MISLPEAEEMLRRHMEQLNVYDLARLRSCFAYEYSIHPEKEANLREILNSIDNELNKRNAGG